ncbi:ATP-binding protein [Streptomyces virginiae]|uniref:ATP-binding protein n=1 Tax=Streptomyces virginiae TaxID=1961 RepID=UPI00380C31E9
MSPADIHRLQHPEPAQQAVPVAAARQCTCIAERQIPQVPAHRLDLPTGRVNHEPRQRGSRPLHHRTDLLDDYAMRRLGASQADDLYELVSERQGRSLIITSNRAPSDRYPLFPNPVVAESLLDRLINTSQQVIMNGPSYRPNKRPENPTDKPPSLRQGPPAMRSSEPAVYSERVQSGARWDVNEHFNEAVAGSGRRVGVGLRCLR